MKYPSRTFWDTLENLDVQFENYTSAFLLNPPIKFLFFSIVSLVLKHLCGFFFFFGFCYFLCRDHYNFPTKILHVVLEHNNDQSILKPVTDVCNICSSVGLSLFPMISAAIILSCYVPGYEDEDDDNGGILDIVYSKKYPWNDLRSWDGFVLL